VITGAELTELCRRVVEKDAAAREAKALEASGLPPVLDDDAVRALALASRPRR